MAQNQTQNNSPQQGGDKYKIDVVFSFTQELDEDDHVVWDLVISIPGMDPIKTRIHNKRYNLEDQVRRLLKLRNVIPILERDVSTDAVRKEMYITLARILWTVMEY
ncbi:conserved archaeal viral protein [Sulfolobus monocaudavirus SMV1]|uniref:conserved archaeal viral protein n=1 Tax=Sulfolobus monocaudavirus SMV1 TaxID=1351702 RepID=UPI0003D86397|nr:conserved archaeal viral protein [Sulfolobus monocaudavirus SMV1]CDF81363.1 conserved archaeal viral protein [Sulfolobus monocaudavirus SMV1]